VVAIVTVYKENAEIFNNYWMPLIWKHGPVNFVVIDNNSTLLKCDSNPKPPNLSIFYAKKDLTRNQARKLGVQQCRDNIIFLASIKGPPTYQTMTLLEGIKENQMLIPRWYDYDRGVKVPPSNKYNVSVEKNKYLNCEEESYIDKWQPEIIQKGTLYYV
tara:strand:+ start:120 stop:596 length:477 start_codon:yes stop_codon:yes gene_type:complete